ncbi:MAG: 23S rRNA (adenine(1618)-N(6))-methyltransferase RlmF [Bacteriovoracaceae bacterium]
MEQKSPLHPKNCHQGRYNFKELTASSPALAPFVARNQYGEESIDFSNSFAVKALNQALLKHFYGVRFWDLPKNYLCPPIPGRADMIHYLADLFSHAKKLKVLDIGVGANCIYPLIGQKVYDWSFVGTDIDEEALKAAQKIITENKLEKVIELRLQKDPNHIFKNIIHEGDQFHMTLSNPPFHSSMEEVQETSNRKWNKLKKSPVSKLNFSGHDKELWCMGGEIAFVTKMIQESVQFQKQVVWFSSLVSKEANLPAIASELKKVRALKSKTIEMAQGQKKSRLVAWTFQE